MNQFKSWAIVCLTTFALWTAAAANVLACESCGGSVGVSNLGVMPNFNRHYVGFRYRLATYRFQSFDGVQADMSQQRLELFGRYCLGKRVQFYGFAPVVYTQTSPLNAPTLSQFQLADFTLQANVTIFNTLDSLRKVRHLLQGGGGVKFPTGNQKSNLPETGTETALVSYPTLKAGTGSFDFFATALYRVSVQKTGLNLETIFKYNLANPDRYRFGVQAGGAASLFHAFYLYPGIKNPERMVLQPQVGAAFEWAGKDARNNVIRQFSGGYAVSATAGLDVFYKKLALGVRGALPLSQNLAAGQLTAKAQFSANIIYFF